MTDPDDMDDVDAVTALWFLEILAVKWSKTPRARIRGYADIIAKALAALDNSDDPRVQALAEANDQRRRDAAELYAKIRKRFAYIKAAGYSRAEAVTMLCDRDGHSRSTVYRALLDDVSRRTAWDKPTVKGDDDA